MFDSLHVEERTLFKRLDLNLILVILALNVIGLINLYSATHGPNTKDVASLFISQIMWLGVGWTVFFVCTVIDYIIVHRIALVIYILNLMAIIYVRPALAAGAPEGRNRPRDGHERGKPVQR